MHERVDIEQTFTPGIEFQHARTYWLQNDTQAVRDIYAELQAIDDVPDALYLPALVDLLQGLLHISSAMYAEAEEALRRAVELTEMIPMTSLFGDARVIELAAKIPAEKFRENGTIAWYGPDYCLDDFIVYTNYAHKREHAAQIDVFGDRYRE